MQAKTGLLVVAAAAAAARADEITKLNTACLMYQGDGCHMIKDEATCLNSRDGRFFEYLDGREMRAEPCVWCGGKPCEPTGNNLCESLPWVVGNPQIAPPSMWVAANCLNGRSIQESESRTPAKSPASSVGPADFEPVNGGDGQACRGGIGAGDGKKYGQWSYSMWTALTLEQCMSYCTGTCTGVEYKAEHNYCEVWWDKVTTSVAHEGYACYKKRDVSDWHEMALPAGAGPATAMAVPIAAAVAATAAPPSAEVPAALGSGDSKAVASEDAAPDLPPRAAAPTAPAQLGADDEEPASAPTTDAEEGDDVEPASAPTTDAEEGDDVDAADDVEPAVAEPAVESPTSLPVAEPSVAATEDVVKREVAIGNADADVGEWAPPAKAPSAGQIGGRFVKGDGGDTNELGVVFWEDANGKHPLPAGVHCSECGCDGENVEIVPQAEIDAKPTGDTFHCTATAAAVPTHIPLNGRFVIVDEGFAAGDGIQPTEELFWEDQSGRMHKVLKRSDCLLCGCDFPSRIAGSEVAAAPRGESFTCKMIPNPSAHYMVRAAAGPDAGASAQAGGMTVPLVAGIGGLLLVGGLFACCSNVMRQQKGKGRKTRGSVVKDHGTDLGLDGEEERVDEEQATAGSSSPATAPLLPPRIAAPIYVMPGHQARQAMLAPAVMPAGPQTVFDQIDRDHDGVISREEWQKYAFDAFDQNHDGRISREEWRAGRTAP